MTRNTGDAYQAYLDARHAAFAVPRPLLEALVRRATGRLPVSLERVVKGNDNEVYMVTLPQGDDLVVRIHRSGSSGPAEEVWSLAMARAAGVPVPEVLLVDRLDHGGTMLEFMVQTRVPGQSLEERLPSLSHAERRLVLRRMGLTLARLHTVRAGGFYRRQPDGRWDFPDWAAFIASAVRHRAAERPWLLEAGFDEDAVAWMIRMIERYGRGFDCAEPVLCHGDFEPAHVFVDDDLRICGVIDFGQYEGNHPIHDFALLSMFSGDAIEAAVRRGYAEAGDLDERFELRLHLHRLMLQIGYLAHFMQIPGHPEVPQYTRGLRETARWLRAHS